MQIEYHALDGASLGTTRYVTALHFGAQDAPRKIYIQTSLHADELTGALVAYHLRPLLEALEAAGRLNAHIVLVPLCNPMGTAQAILHEAAGRFDLYTGRNFNRITNFPYYERVLAILTAQNEPWSADAAINTARIRAAMKSVIDAYQPQFQIDVLQHILVRMAYDADIVLDLHCDETAVLHLYTLPQLWPRVAPLARLLGSQCQIVSEDSASNAFDEFMSTPWLKLSKHFMDAAIPLACTSVTVELRGQADLRHELARDDAQALVDYLIHTGDIVADASGAPELPVLLREPNPLSGLCYVRAPEAGVVVFAVRPGDTVVQGQTVAELVDPIHQRIVPVVTPNAGFVYALQNVHYAQQGATLVSVSGARDLGAGEALGG